MSFDSARERHSAKSQKIVKQLQRLKSPPNLLLHSLLHSLQGQLVHGAFRPIRVIYRMLARQLRCGRHGLFPQPQTHFGHEVCSVSMHGGENRIQVGLLQLALEG
jgi:hypothetical protein